MDVNTYYLSTHLADKGRMFSWNRVNNEFQNVLHFLTGYIPGMSFRYGKSFQRAADDSVMDFNRQMSHEEIRREKERSHRSQSAPKMPSIRSRDELKKTLQHCQNRKYGGMYVK